MLDTYVQTGVAREVAEYLERAAFDERPGVISIIGAGGTGKTTLLRYLERQLRVQGHYTLYQSASEERDFGGLISGVARRLLRHLQSSQDLSALLPANTGTMLRAILGHRISERDTQAIDVLKDVASNLPPGRSLILLLDDLDVTEEDRQLSSFVKRLADRGSQKIQIVLAGRSFGFERFPSLLRAVRSYRLEGFTRAEAEEFVSRALFDNQADRSQVARFVESSGGNPQFLSLLLEVMKRGESLEGIAPSDQIGDILESMLPSSTPSRRLLELLAVLGPLGAPELCELMGTSVAQFQQLSERLMAQRLIVESDVVFITHRAIGEHLRRRLVAQTELDPRTFEFGAEEAERDQELLGSLVSIPWVAPLLNGKKSIVLGDRGSGKSALFRLLAQAPKRITGEPVPTLSILTEQNPGAFVQRMSAHNPDVSSAEQFKAVWLTLVAARVAEQLISDKVKIDRRLQVRARRLAELRGAHDPGFFRKLGRRVSGLKLTLGPVTLEPADGSWHLLGSTIDVETFLSDVAVSIQNADRRLLVVVDRIDEVYKYQRPIQEALVQGLFLAESHLGSFGHIDFVALLRTDLFEIYDIQEKNKFQSRMVTLTWHEEDIVLALLKRLYANAALRGLAERLGIEPHGTAAHRAAALRLVFPVEVENEDFESWFLSSMRNGRGRISPRQVILFLNAARDYLREQEYDNLLLPLFPPKIVRQAMERVSELSHDEVVSDFRIATTLIRNCRAGRITEFILDDVDQLIDPSEGSRTEQVERLEELGFLRRVVRMDGDGERTTHFVVPELYTRCWEGKEAVS